jgi:hypothetical protein
MYSERKYKDYREFNKITLHMFCFFYIFETNWGNVETVYFLQADLVRKRPPFAKLYAYTLLMCFILLSFLDLFMHSAFVQLFLCVLVWSFI